jgi:TolB-like protein
LLALLLGAGCAHTTTSRPPAKRQLTVESSHVKLAVLPVDGQSYPRIAEAINALLVDVQLPGVDEYFVSKVSLEVVQLSIECLENSEACYGQVGRSLGAQLILLGQVQPRGAKKGDRGVKVSFVLFDVQKGRVVRSAEDAFDDESKAVRGAPDLLNKTVSQPVSAAALRRPERAA